MKKQLLLFHQEHFQRRKEFSLNILINKGEAEILLFIISNSFLSFFVFNSAPG
jgi:hypothetical protein